MNVPQRLEQLRRLMAEQGLHAYYIPSTDPHHSEYVADTWQRRAFISGFRGSAGTVVVTLGEAALWTDSRYFLEAEEKLKGSGIQLMKMGLPETPSLEDWIASRLSEEQVLGLDPWVVSCAEVEALKKRMSDAHIELQFVDRDLVEEVWGDSRPPLPQGKIRRHPESLAGESSTHKLQRLRGALKAHKADAMLLVALDEIAWTLNLRGQDIDFNPVFISYLWIQEDAAFLFVEASKMTPDALSSLPPGTQLRPYGSLGEFLSSERLEDLVVWVDPATTHQAAATALAEQGARVIRRPTPVATWKAAKNSVEVAGMVSAHRKDGVSMVRFLKWLSQAVPKGTETELSIQEQVARFRSNNEGFVGLSFNSIVGYAGHGAIVHYAASPDSDVPVKAAGILLVDSGGQYLDGTTDITRTVALGMPTQEQKAAYTGVLKGHLALGRAWFPEGTDGYQLDVLARAPLWAMGLNYGHGTGHGVGAYLGVHEGPFSVSLRKNMTPLAAGNILSDEPGFYKTGEFGIRIENLVLVTERANGDYGRFLGFDPLTLCPYDRNLIDLGMLNPEEIRQIDQYHRRVFDTLSSLLEPDEAEWLEEATAPLT